MKRFLALGVTLLSLKASEGASSNSSCIDSLDTIYDAETNITDETVLREYVLCPNTTFTIASDFSDDGRPSGGQFALTISRPNIHVRCGDDGKSSNQCILASGHEQLKFISGAFAGNRSVVTNAVVQGLTFSEGDSINVVAQADGELFLIDCVFSNNNNMALLKVAPSGDKSNGNRFLRATDSEDQSSRRTDATIHGVKVFVLDSAFEDNEIWSYSGESVEGLIIVTDASLEISNSTFVRTRLDEAEQTKLEYHILAVRSNLTLWDNCFLDNDDNIAPVVNDGGTIQAVRNSVQRSTTVLPYTGCPFISHGPSDKTMVDGATFWCHASDGPTCTSSSLARTSLQCFSDLTLIYQAEQALTTDVQTRTYRLCPNQEYNIKTTTDVALDGETSPLIIARSNVHIMCGADGRSENNCTLNGGSYQLSVHDEFRAGKIPLASNTLVQGLTFFKATSANVLVGAPSDITFKDCIFKKNSNLASIYVEYVDPDHRPLDRREEENGAFALAVNVFNSRFEDNILGTVPRASSGVITSFDGNLYLFGNSFSGMINPPEEPTRSSPGEDVSLSSLTATPSTDETFVGYIIGTFGGTLKITENCFTGNGATIAPVVSYGGKVYTAANSGDSSSGPSNTCDFLALVEVDGDPDAFVLTSDTPSTCVHFDRDSCDGFGSGMYGFLTPVEPTKSSNSWQDNSVIQTLLYCLLAVALILAVVAIAIGVRERRANRLSATPVVVVVPPELNDNQFT